MEVSAQKRPGQKTDGSRWFSHGESVHCAHSWSGAHNTCILTKNARSHEINDCVYFLGKNSLIRSGANCPQQRTHAPRLRHVEVAQNVTLEKAHDNGSDYGPKPTLSESTGVSEHLGGAPGTQASRHLVIQATGLGIWTFGQDTGNQSKHPTPSPHEPTPHTHTQAKYTQLTHTQPKHTSPHTPSPHTRPAQAHPAITQSPHLHRPNHTPSQHTPSQHKHSQHTPSPNTAPTE